MVEKVSKIWMDGNLIPWKEANVHILTHSLHYGLAVFEGIRCYLCHDGKSAVFRLREHVDRLFDSAQIADIKIPYSKREISEACRETLRVNQLREGYIRPIVFIGEGVMGVYPGENPIQVAIINMVMRSLSGGRGYRKRNPGKGFLLHPSPCQCDDDQGENLRQLCELSSSQERSDEDGI